MTKLSGGWAASRSCRKLRHSLHLAMAPFFEARVWISLTFPTSPHPQGMWLVASISARLSSDRWITCWDGLHLAPITHQSPKSTVSGGPAIAGFGAPPEKTTILVYPLGLVSNLRQKNLGFGRTTPNSTLGCHFAPPSQNHQHSTPRHYEESSL